MAREIPDLWKPYMEAKGLDSYRSLAVRAKVAPATVIRLLNSEGSAEVKTVEAVADVLGLTTNQVLEMHGTSVRDYGPFDWPDEVRYLTPRQRDAIASVVRSMAEPETQGGSGKSGLTLVGGGATGTRKAARKGAPKLDK